MRCTVTALAVAATMAVVPLARAQQSGPLAEALFREGQRLSHAGRTAEACIKFAESQRIEPALGTLLNLAVCHEKEGKTASAWAEFMRAAELAELRRQKDRAAFARDRATELEKKRYAVVLDVKRPSASMAIVLDGQKLEPGAWGMPLPVDPGEHTFMASAPNKVAWRRTVVVPPGAGTLRIDVPALEDAGAEMTKGAPGVGPATVASPVTVPSSSSPSSPEAGREMGADAASPDGAKRNLGLLVGGAGVLALGTGVFFGVRSVLLGNQSDREAKRADDFERSGDRTNAAIQRDASVRDHDDAGTNRAIGFVAGGVGLVALGVGVYLFATAKDPSRRSLGGLRGLPELGPRAAGARVSFTF
ncbi:hypothetical protein [Pendulispora albinea]|uniref:PEGA domain-containing protein n=1 Tax=Pendulispora albinea TaxID=2741071 RepID=A0ABZ2LWY3_9BACT